MAGMVLARMVAAKVEVGKEAAMGVGMGEI